MTKRDDKITLTEIAQNIRLARSFMAGLDQVAFAVDSKTIYAVVRALEIISEGTRRLPDDLQSRHPMIPWRAVKGAGNIYRHVYHDLQATVIWDTAHKPLDDLLVVVELELARLSVQNGGS